MVTCNFLTARVGHLDCLTRDQSRPSCWLLVYWVIKDSFLSWLDFMTGKGHCGAANRDLKKGRAVAKKGRAARHALPLWGKHYWLSNLYVLFAFFRWHKILALDLTLSLMIFKVSLTIFEFSLTFFKFSMTFPWRKCKNQFSMTFPDKTHFPWLFQTCANPGYYKT